MIYLYCTYCVLINSIIIKADKKGGEKKTEEGGEKDKEDDDSDNSDSDTEPGEVNVKRLPTDHILRTPIERWQESLLNSVTYSQVLPLLPYLLTKTPRTVELFLNWCRGEQSLSIFFFHLV